MFYKLITPNIFLLIFIIIITIKSLIYSYVLFSTKFYLYTLTYKQEKGIIFLSEQIAVIVTKEIPGLKIIHI